MMRRTPLRHMSPKQAKASRERAATVKSLWPTRPQCAMPGCHQPADDVHEPRFRSRLGSATDPENMRPLCRRCHHWVHAHDTEAARLGLAVHSWDHEGGTA